MTIIANPKKFAHDLCDWYRIHHRKLPFRETSEPYHILVSELMLQQTQMDTVIPYYERFIERFPDVFTLANAELSEVLKHWEGLGYYRRARHLHESAKMIVSNYHGVFPKQYNDILTLKGIGEYTAGAIHSIAFNQPTPAVDGNVIRVLSRLSCYVEDGKATTTQKYFKALLKDIIIHEKPSDFTQAMMELGALICKKQPLCDVCPVQAHCLGYQTKTQLQYPVMKPAKPKVTEHYKTFIIRDSENDVLLEQRPENGLLANLMGFPQYQGDSLDTALEQLNHDFRIEGLTPEFIGTVKHVFSHRVWHMEVYLIEIKSTKDSSKFYSLDAIPGAISKAHSKILKNLKEKT